MCLISRTPIKINLKGGEKSIDKLEKKIILEFIIICVSIFTITTYLMGLIIPNLYFSDFLLSTIQVISVGVIMMFMLPIYFHDLKIADGKYKMRSIIIVNKRFWGYCITVSGGVSIISIISFLVLYGLVILLNLTSRVLNIIATVLMIIVIISFIIVVVMVVVRDVIEKEHIEDVKGG